ncbi:hypothetical protein CYY_009367 [Polysphondylium violaceum]|uniref:Beta-lactamase-related domain-containing protein n=1 Tax=Polysphondylium violaceum TaxID=133409 RepID=A0A8J4V311_9MYCE|nr:hypothetical protein CYY_009367 [Polysphondylium violaceum]
MNILNTIKTYRGLLTTASFLTLSTGSFLAINQKDKVLCEENKVPTPLNNQQQQYFNASRSKLDPITRSDIAKEIISWKEKCTVPGISVCVMSKNQTVFREAYGYSDIENGVVMNTSSKLRIASISKTLTSVAIGLLMEDNLLKLDDHINKFVPNFPKHPNFPEVEITVGHLASHLSGIRHYLKGEKSEFYSVKQYKSAKEFNPFNHSDPLEIFISNPWIEKISTTKPGALFHYSTFGYTLLGAIIENISGTDYKSFMRTRVFNRCGMYNIFADEHNVIIPNRSKQYTLRPLDKTNIDRMELMNTDFTNSSYKWAGGGWISTAEDICRFGSTLISGKLLKPETINTLFTPLKTTEGVETNYGFGWMNLKNNLIDNDNDNPNILDQDNKIIFHTGHAMGGATVLVLLPKEQIVVCVLANQEKIVGIQDLGFKIARLVSKSEKN